MGYLLGHVKFGGGVVGGVIGAVAATVAIFLPSFLLVAALGPMLQRLRSLAWARGALDGMNAAVVGLMVVAAVRLGASALLLPGTGRVDVLGVILVVCSSVGLQVKVNSTWLIVAAACIGTVMSIVRP